jgi:hypothetical protein
MKIGSTIIIIILLLALVQINFNLSGKNIETEEENDNEFTSNPRGNEEFIWEDLEVISEPVPFKNFNIAPITYNPAIVAENHNVYIVWEETNHTMGSGSDSDICFRHYNGNSWSEIQVISEPILGSNTNLGSSRDPDIAVDDGKIYVVWWDDSTLGGSGSDYDIYYRCNISGSNWEDIQIISEPVSGQNYNKGNSEYPDITVEDRKIYIVWDDKNNTNNAGSDKDIFYICNITGNNWEKVQVISEPVSGNNYNIGDSDYPVIEVEDGKIYAIWADVNNTHGSGGSETDIFYKTNFTGFNWETVQVISEPIPGLNINDDTSLFPDFDVENGKIYVTWTDRNDTDSSSQGIWDWDIFYRCNLSGYWEKEQVISEPVKGENFNIGQSHYSKISVENGRIFVVWDDSNNTNSAGTDDDIFLRYNLTGLNWDDINVISEPVKNGNNNTGWSEEPDIIVNLGKIHVVWFDDNNSNNAGTDKDIFYKATFLPLGLYSPNVIPTIGNTSTNFNFTVTYKNVDNYAPTQIKINISNSEYTLLEVEPLDVTYYDGKDYFYKTSNLAIGKHTFYFHATDGQSDGFTSPIKKPMVYNSPPKLITIDNLTAYEDVYYNIDYEYNDIDVITVGQNIIWNYSSNASWLNFDTVTGLLDGTPTDSNIGGYWVNISINDTMEIDFTNFTLTVLNVNDNPVINTTNVEITYEDELYEVDYNATDIDSIISNQIWSLGTNATSWLDIDPTTGILNGTPINDDVGSYWVNVSVIDGDDGLAFTNFSLIVINVNDPPVIITEDIVKSNTSELYEVDYNATDIDSPSLQFLWSVNTNATWLDIDSSTGILNGTPLKTDVGWYNVNVTINDGDDGIDWHDFVLEVIKKNEPPTITTTDVLSATVNIPYQVKYEATDEDTPLDKLTWFLDTNASWLGIGPVTGILGGTPRDADLGSYWVKVLVNDGEGGIDSHNFTLTVYSTLNQPPNITTEDVTNAIVDEEYSVDYEAEDDRTPISNLLWSLETNASWLGIENNTGVLSGTPNATHVGWYWVKVSVFDREDGWDFTNFTLYVTIEPITSNKPELSNPSMTPSTGDTNTEFTFSVDYSHPDGDLPDSIQVVIDDLGYEMTLTNGHYEYKTKLSEGNHTYYFTTKLGNFKVDTDIYNTGYITKAEGQPEDGDRDREDYNTMLYAGIGIVVIIIIIVLILLFIFLKKKKGKEEEPVVEAQPPPPEEAPPEVPPEQVPTPETPPLEQAPTPMVPPEEVPIPEITPEQVPSPETPSPEHPQVQPEQPQPTPEVTPQEPQPQVEPGPPEPMLQVEEQPAPQPQVEPLQQGQAPVPKIKTPEENAEG